MQTYERRTTKGIHLFSGVSPNDIPAQTPMLSANVELINHPDGETVEVYIRQGESRTASITATNLAEGSSFMPADIDISEANFPPGEYEFVVMLSGQAQFAKAFEIR